MAANIPAALKQAGITPFVVRAAQLEKTKPVISYWCEYWVINLILAKQLHNADAESHNFTTTLMDKLEQTKIEHAGNEAILNDADGRAYVEQFAQETFERAMRPLKANKVTKQTAITFEAAATFLQLINIWGIPDPETEQKIKFSKWNAARILRAIKDGKDPNESNPKQEEDEREEIDNNDPELQAIMSGGQPQAATVEDAPDEEGGGHLDPAAASVSPYSPGPVSAPTSPPQASAPAPEQVSPIAPPDQVATDGYFPSAPSGVDDDPPLQLPSAPGRAPTSDLSLGGPSAPTIHPSLDPQGSPTLPSSGQLSPPVFPNTPQDFYQQGPPPVLTTSNPPTTAPRTQQQSYQSTTQSPPQPPSSTNSYHQQPPHQVSQRNIPTFVPPPQPQSVPPPQQSYGGGPPTNSVYNADDKAIVTAQKHAKWAISALNFDDVPTAVRELKAALAVLGAI